MGAASRHSNLHPKKIALLHVAQRDLKLGEDDYRAILERIAGVDSARDLDELGFEAVIKHLTTLGFRSTWTKRTYGHRAGMATPAQIDFIRKLWRDYAGPDEGDKALNAWLNHCHQVAALRFVTSDKAQAVLSGLKMMAKRGVRQQGAESSPAPRSPAPNR